MRPAPERPGDALPTPDDFAGWPALGALRVRASAGPLAFDMERVDARVAEALADFASGGELASGDVPSARIQWTRADRGAWLAASPGDRARSFTWIEGGALAWATHHAALLMDAEATSGIAVLTDQDASAAARSAQNVLRVAAAWALASSRRGLLLHASAVSDGGSAILFVGPSGAGKSTAARLSAPRAVLADDACIVTAEEGRAWLHPAPLWAEPAFAGRHDARERIPIERILRLRQGSPHAIQPLGRSAATASLLAHAPFLENLPPLACKAEVAERIAAVAAVSELRFGPDAGFWSVVDRFRSARAESGRDGSNA